MSLAPLPRANRLLASLPAADLEALAGQLQAVPLAHKETLYRPGDRLSHVYFPTSGVISLLAQAGDRDEIEVATVGREGMVCLRSFWDDLPASHTFVVQVPGEALRLPAPALQAESARRGPLYGVLCRYTSAFLFQVAQSVACNGLHTVRQRCCRWLLMTRDRVDSDRITLTQDFLAKMLGVRRAGVAEVAHKLQEKGYIDYTRGTITIRNRQGLEEAACDCYEAILKEWDRLGLRM